MSELHDLLDELAARVNPPPVVISERCVHTRVELASCRACVTACPHEAWRLSDEELGIDTEACDGCGLCAAVCPEGALLHQHQPAQGMWNNARVAIAACERTGLSAASGVVPCLHALGLRDLLQLYSSGVRRLLVCCERCDECERGQNQRLHDVSRHANALLASRGLAPLAYHEVSSDEWACMLEGMGGRPVAPLMGRRSFLRRSVGVAVEEGMKITGLMEAEQNSFVPPGTLLPNDSVDHTAPFVPQVAEDTCSGCDACAKLCPHGAIALVQGENEAHYQIDSNACTGCGICVDICEQGAVSINSMVSPTQTRVPLQHGRCRACGTTFHLPSLISKKDSLCPTCAKARHQSKLYQVMP